MSASDVARELHVSRQSVDRYIREGKLRARMIRVGKRGFYQVRRSDFRVFVRRWIQDDWA